MLEVEPEPHALVAVAVIEYVPDVGAVTETLVTEGPDVGVVVIVAPVADQLYEVAPATGRMEYVDETEGHVNVEPEIEPKVRVGHEQ